MVYFIATSSYYDILYNCGWGVGSIGSIKLILWSTAAAVGLLGASNTSAYSIGSVLYFYTDIDSTLGLCTASLGSCMPFNPYRVATYESFNMINHVAAPWHIVLQATLAKQRDIAGSYSHIIVHRMLLQSCELNLQYLLIKTQDSIVHYLIQDWTIRAF